MRALSSLPSNVPSNVPSWSIACAFAIASVLSGCGSAPTKDAPPVAQAPRDMPAADAEPKRSPYAPAQEDPSKRGDYVAGGLYAPHIQDSVPDYVPDVAAIPEPDVKDEPRSRFGNRSYSVLGKTYRVLESGEGYVEEGTASFYGKKFHGRLTSNQEVYDMNAFSAAHRSLPLPSYARVTNLDNGKSVVVRVNDRGPFHSGRIIDLSYAAAVKLDFIRRGTARVEVRALQPDDADGRRTTSRRERTRRERTREETAKPPVAAAAPAVPTPSADPALRAEEFDRWMRERGVRVASGRPGSANAASTPMATSPVDVSTPAASTPQAAAVEGGVSLQVAAFSAQDNAERARQRLLDAGLSAVRIDAGDADGKPIWRVRIGPVAADRVAELSARCADLGFETVQVVRE